MGDNPWDTISWITHDLALTSHVPAQDRQIITESGFQTIISIGESRGVEGSGWSVLHFTDVGVDGAESAYITRIVAAISGGVARGKTLVHCTAGASRSAGIVVLYVAVTQGLQWSEALALVKQRRPVVEVEGPLAEVLQRWLRRHRQDVRTRGSTN